MCIRDSFVYVTHDQEEALTLSDTIVVMSEGRIQQIGVPTDIYNEPVSYTHLQELFLHHKVTHVECRSKSRISITCITECHIYFLAHIVSNGSTHFDLFRACRPLERQRITPSQMCIRDRMRRSYR